MNMLKPVVMQKIRVLLPRVAMPAAVAALHDMGVVEITTADYPSLEKGKPLPQYDEIAEQLVRVRAMKRALEPFAGAQKIKAERLEAQTALDAARELTLDKTLRAWEEKKEQIKNRQAALREQLRLARTLQAFGSLDFSRLRTASTDFWLGKGATNQITALENWLQHAVPIHDLYTTPLNERETLLLITYRKGQPLEEEAAAHNLQRIDVPPTLAVPEHAAREIGRELETIVHEVHLIQEQLQQMAESHYARIVSLERSLSIEADRSQIVFLFQFTASVAVITGWIPQPELGRLQGAMERVHPATVVEALPEDVHELPPTLLENPASVHPIQFITERYSLPNAKEIDPTLVYAITIPLLYGMIVGDVLYGIASYFIAGWILQKFKSSLVLNNVARVWQIAALPSVLFGVLFDEWGGMGHLQLLETLGAWGLPLAIHAPLYLPFVHRVHDLSGLIALTLVSGLIHLALGFILGAVNAWHHSKKHALAKLAWLLVEISGTLAVTSYLFGVFPPEAGMAGVIGVVLGAILLFFTEGVVGILEIPGFAGNVLSYVRIAAIGVVGVLLAEIINEAFLPLPEQGILALVFFPLFLALHAVNAFIAMFESLIQGGRLNIIEFRSKFLVGGGKPFEPFSYSYE